MTQKEITIAGKTIHLAYCYATEIGFHKLTNKSIEKFSSDNPEDAMYLIIASMLSWYQSNGEVSPHTDEQLMYGTKPTEIIEAVTVIFKLRAEWYNIPIDEPKDNEEEAPKNP